MRPRVLVASLAAHALLGLALLAVPTGEPPRSSPPRAAVVIEIATSVPASASTPPTADGTGAAQKRALLSSGRTGRGQKRGPTPSARERVADLVGAVEIEDGDGSGGGLGAGNGSGRGRGFGLGDGAHAGPGVDGELETPPAPVASKARPARLVYPSRERDADDSETFVARVTVDDDGFVVGATLVRGVGGRRDEMAEDLIWKFRYAPALDDDGRPVRSQLEQRFLVGR